MTGEQSDRTRVAMMALDAFLTLGYTKEDFTVLLQGDEIGIDLKKGPQGQNG